MSTYRKNFQNVPQFMELTPASEYFGHSKYFFRKGIKEGRIAYVMSGNRYMIDVQAFQKQLDNNVVLNANQNQK